MKGHYSFRKAIAILIGIVMCLTILPASVLADSTMDETTVTITKSISFNVVGNKADIVFLFDISGSMGGYITNVCENIKVFTDILDSGNVDYRIAVITFCDITVPSDPATSVLTDATGNHWFTSSDEVARNLSTITLGYGGDGPESSFDGFGMMLNDLTFRERAFKAAILLTDADYKTNNHYGIVNTIQLINKLIDGSFCTTVVSKPHLENYYSDIVENTEGIFCDITGDFGEQLADLSTHIINIIEEENEENREEDPAYFPVPGVAIIEVTDSKTGEPIQGVKYDLYRLNPSGGKDTKIGETRTTKSTGKITVSHVTSDYYYWKAAGTAEGYYPDNGKHVFRVIGTQFVTTEVALEPVGTVAAEETPVVVTPIDEPTVIEAVQPAALPFTDVSADDADVLYVYENNIMNGVSDTEFAPDAALTRAMVVTILHRIENAPEIVFAGVFSDVENGTWYSNAIEWAASEGIVNGYTDGSFGPTDSVTREQLAAILYRYANAQNYATDVDTVVEYALTASGYAVEAVNWAVCTGILTTENDPSLPATRAEVAAAIHVFMTNVAE